MINLRLVEVTNQILSKAKDHPGEDISYEKEICFFHQFTGGYMSEPIAIVENKQGKVYQVPIACIRFLQGGEVK